VEEDVVVAIDLKSFPKKCDALDTIRSILRCSFVDIDTISPRAYLKRCEELTEHYSLVIPCTRNMFIRDYLLSNNVDLILTV
jgi:hypothetical protein